MTLTCCLSVIIGFTPPGHSSRPAAGRWSCYIFIDDEENLQLQIRISWVNMENEKWSKLYFFFPGSINPIMPVYCHGTLLQQINNLTNTNFITFLLSLSNFYISDLQYIATMGWAFGEQRLTRDIHLVSKFVRKSLKCLKLIKLQRKIGKDLHIFPLHNIIKWIQESGGISMQIEEGQTWARCPWRVRKETTVETWTVVRRLSTPHTFKGIGQSRQLSAKSPKTWLGDCIKLYQWPWQPSFTLQWWLH